MMRHMGEFSYYNPTKIEFGPGKIAKLEELIPIDKKVLIIYGQNSAKKYGTLDQVYEVLREYTVDEFGGIEANPQYETCVQAIQKVKDEGFDFLLAVGGGSVIDATKFIAVGAMMEEEPRLIFGGDIGENKPITAALPLASIVTLPATGSEANKGSVITFPEHQAKLGWHSPLVYPQFSILDPTLTYTLPERQLANGICDAFVHTLEIYLTYPVDAKIPDRFAEGILQTLVEVAPDVMDTEQHNYAARANFMWSATVALNGWLRTGVPEDWSTHWLGHEITALNGTDHARSLTAILPALMDICRQQKAGKLVMYAERVWGITEGDQDTKIDQAIMKTAEFFRSLGMPTCLSDVGVEEADIDFLTEQLVRHDKINLSERGDQNQTVNRQIYKRALTDFQL